MSKMARKFVGSCTASCSSSRCAVAMRRFCSSSMRGSAKRRRAPLVAPARSSRFPGGAQRGGRAEGPEADTLADGADPVRSGTTLGDRSAMRATSCPPRVRARPAAARAPRAPKPTQPFDLPQKCADLSLSTMISFPSARAEQRSSAGVSAFAGIERHVGWPATAYAGPRPRR